MIFLAEKCFAFEGLESKFMSAGLGVVDYSNKWSCLQVVEEMEKDMLGNSEGSGEDMSQISEGPKVSISETSAPQFMRAKLWSLFLWESSFVANW